MRRTIRNRCRRDSRAWRVAWRTHEVWAAVKLFFWRRQYRARNAIRSRVGVAVWSGGRDCDGMAYGGVQFYWTRAGAERAAEDWYVYAEGPCWSHVVSAREGREIERDWRPDPRDRFAERMNY